MSNNITVEQIAHRLEATVQHNARETANLLAELGDTGYLLSLSQQENAQLKQEIAALKEELNVSEEDE